MEVPFPQLALAFVVVSCCQSSLFLADGKLKPAQDPPVNYLCRTWICFRFSWKCVSLQFLYIYFFSLAFSQFISDDFGGCKAIRTWPAPDTHTKELLKLPAFSLFHFIFLHFFTALLFCVYLCKDKLSEFSFVFSPGLSPYLCAFLLLSCSCFPAFRWVKQ